MPFEGAVSGPIGAHVTDYAKGLVKFGIRGASRTLSKGAKLFRGQKAIVASLETPIAIGVAAGTVLDASLKEAEVHKQELAKIHNNRELTRVQKKMLRKDYKKLNNLPEKDTIMNSFRRKIHKLKEGAQQGKKLIEGQYGIDVENDTGKRGPERVIVETTDHNYDGVRIIPDPCDALSPEQSSRDFDEDNDKKNNYIAVAFIQRLHPLGMRQKISHYQHFTRYQNNFY